DPRREKPRTDEGSERVADSNHVTGFDARFDVEDSGDVSTSIHEYQVVVGGRVGLRRRTHPTDFEDFAGDGRRSDRGCAGRRPETGIGREVDRTTALVGDVGRIIQRKALVHREHGRGEGDGHEWSKKRGRLAFAPQDPLCESSKDGPPTSMPTGHEPGSCSSTPKKP